jgi:hypothetical protein
MTPAQRCDEIIRMIDEVLDGQGNAGLGTVGTHRPQLALDRKIAPARPVARP